MKLVIFDMDGVVMRGNDSVPYAADAISHLKQSGIIVRYLTNNSTRTPDAFAKWISEAGIDVTPTEIMTSSIATAMYLQKNWAERGKVLVVGEYGIVEALTDAGFEVVDYDDPSPVDFVVVGQDRKITYERIARAQHEIWVNEACFLATNRDPLFPVEDGKVKPGGGVMVHAIEVCTRKEAIVIGKPNCAAIEMLLEELGVEPSEALMVGDNLDTDIPAGKAAGTGTVFVLTGIHGKEDLKKLNKDTIPDFIISDLSTLKDCL